MTDQIETEDPAPYQTRAFHLEDDYALVRNKDAGGWDLQNPEGEPILRGILRGMIMSDENYEILGETIALAYKTGNRHGWSNGNHQGITTVRRQVQQLLGMDVLAERLADIAANVMRRD